VVAVVVGIINQDILEALVAEGEVVPINQAE
jgi:hypothetical protein